MGSSVLSQVPSSVVNLADEQAGMLQQQRSQYPGGGYNGSQQAYSGAASAGYGGGNGGPSAASQQQQQQQPRGAAVSAEQVARVLKSKRRAFSLDGQGAPDAAAAGAAGAAGKVVKPDPAADKELCDMVTTATQEYLKRLLKDLTKTAAHRHSCQTHAKVAGSRGPDPQAALEMRLQQAPAGGGPFRTVRQYLRGLSVCQKEDFNWHTKKQRFERQQQSRLRVSESQQGDDDKRNKKKKKRGKADAEDDATMPVDNGEQLRRLRDEHVTERDKQLREVMRETPGSSMPRHQEITKKDVMLMMDNRRGGQKAGKLPPKFLHRAEVYSCSVKGQW